MYVNSNACTMIRKVSFVYSRVFLEINLLGFFNAKKKRGWKDGQMQRKRNVDTEKENKLWIEKDMEKVSMTLSF